MVWLCKPVLLAKCVSALQSCVLNRRLMSVLRAEALQSMTGVQIKARRHISVRGVASGHAARSHVWCGFGPLVAPSRVSLPV